MKIKCVTLNLWKEGDLLDRAGEFLQREDPDVVFLQEVYDAKASHLEKRFRSFEILKETLSLEHYAFSPAFRDITEKFRLNANQGNAIFSRFPIVENKEIFLYGHYREIHDYQEHPEGFAALPRIMQSVSVLAGQTKINCFNVHGIWGVDGSDNQDRDTMSRIIIEEIKDQKNVVLAGDFNTNPEIAGMRRIGTHLTNVFGDTLESTFNMKRKNNPGFARAVVDMMFVSPELKVVERYCPPVDISDHLPLVAVFDIGN